MLGGARGLVPGVALAVLLAGCLAPGQTVSPSDLDLPALLPAVPGLPIVVDHDHDDPALHAASFATSLVGSAGGAEAAPGTGFGELDVRDGWAYVCRVGFAPGLGPLPAPVGGFVVVDAADPAAPVQVGAFEGPGCFDIKVNEANDLVLFAAQRDPWFGALTSEAGPEARQPRGVYLVNVADKANPVYEGFVPMPVNGVHTIHYTNMDGRELVFLQSYDWIPDGGLGLPLPNTGFNNPATQRVQVYEVAGSPGSRSLELLSVFLLPVPPPPGTNYFPHDITVQKHPLTGQWLGYVAYWDAGLVVLDLDDPANPVMVSSFADTSPSAFVNVHQARPFPHLIAGRHVTVLEPEIAAAEESGQFTLVDTTDPANPQRLGYWELPGDVVIPGGFLFSPHNFNLANGRIYLAHNHGGVWVVDVGTEERLRQPVAVGFYQPHAGAREDCTQSSVWSAFYVAGHVYASDRCEGLLVLQFDADRGLAPPGPAAVMPSAGEA